MTLRFEAEAAEELYRAVQYYEGQSAGLGGELLDDLDRVAGLLVASPNLGSPGPSGTRRILLSRFPFVVVYKFWEDEPVVVAFSHQRQRPGYWLDRI